MFSSQKADSSERSLCFLLNKASPRRCPLGSRATVCHWPRDCVGYGNRDGPICLANEKGTKAKMSDLKIHTSLNCFHFAKWVCVRNELNRHATWLSGKNVLILLYYFFFFHNKIRENFRVEEWKLQSTFCFS